jgi:hypothetical protein
MSYREWVEQELQPRILEELVKRGGSHGRVWLNPAQYEFPTTFEQCAEIKPTRELKVFIPTHSYQIFEFNDEELKVFIEDCCKKIEKSFIDVISAQLPANKIKYIDGDIKISLEYRVCIIYISYNLES